MNQFNLIKSFCTVLIICLSTCYTYSSPPVSEIGTINFEPACDGDISYGSIDFDYANTSDSFNLSINSDTYTFAYTDLPVSISPLPDNGNTYMLVTVIDQIDPSCINEVDHDGIDCTPDDCNITNLEISPAECNPGGGYDLTINFEVSNPGNDFFDLFNNNGDLIGFYEIADLPITLTNYEPSQDDVEFFTVCINDTPSCCATYGIDLPICNNDCLISDLIANPSDCNFDSVFFVDLDFNYSNTSDSFSIVGNGMNYGNFAYIDLPITLGPFEDNGQTLEFIVTDLEQNDCNEATSIDAPFCPCNLATTAYNLDCNDDGFFYSLFTVVNSSSSGIGYQILVNGELFGEYSYDESSIEVGPLEGNGQTIVLTAVDINDPECNSFYTIVAPVCDPSVCEVSNFVSTDPVCNPSGGYDITLDFNYQNPGNDFFEFFNADFELIGTYALADLPLTLENYEPFYGDLDVFTVCINDNPNCCIILTVAFPPCTNDDCSITNMEVSPAECNPGGGYDLAIHFEVTNPGNNFFDLFNNNGDLIGFYEIGDLPITLTNYEPSQDGVEFFTVCINDNPNCCATYGIDFPICTNNCVITDLIVEAHDCDPNDNFLVDLDFNYTGTSDSFSVVGNAMNYGNFAYTDLFITLGPFEGNGQSLEFIVTDLEFLDCSAEVGLTAPDCTNDDCSITNMEVSPAECNPGGGYDLAINFEVTNPGNNFFDLFNNNGDLIGFYEIADLPITLTNYEPSQDNVEFFTVCINDNPNCCATYGIDFPTCTNNCELGDITITNTPCDSNGDYTYSIDFDYANTSDSFQLIVLGVDYGNYAYTDLPFDVGMFNISQIQTIVIEVIDLENPNCSGEALYIVDCEGTGNDCAISDLVIEAFCDGDELYAEISFEYNGNGSDSFQIISCAPLDTLEYNTSGTYTIQIPDDIVNCAGGVIIPIGIFDLDNIMCSAAEFLFIPDCYDSECTINEVIAEVSDCDNESFSVTIDFDYQNVGDNGFSIIGNGEDYGDFDYSQIPVTLGPFIGNGQELEFLIFDNDDDGCSNLVEITAPECVEPPMNCIEFEGLIDGLNYGGSNSQPGDLLMIENNVHVTMEGVTDPLGNLNYDYMFATTQDICNPFDAANDNRIFMFNGLKFDFSALSQNPTLVSFPYHNCGIPFSISVNEQQSATYLFPQSDTTFNLSPTVVIDIQIDDSNSEEGIITLQGVVESFLIGGVELQIDNVCFNVENLVPDVWPGDANFDNIANHFDLLHIGIAYGSEGEPRDMTDIDWFAMPAEDWSSFFADEETNYKHADCNGDGEVQINDRGAILENYNLSHGDTPIFVQVPGTPEDPPFFVDLPSADDIEIGALFSAPIILGDVDFPVDQIYGIAFTIEFDPIMMAEDQVSIELGDSWMGEDGQNIINLDRKFASEGEIEVALTRINQENASGFGTIGNFIGIIDDILGKTEVEVIITGVKAIRYNETPVPLYTPTELVDLATNTSPVPMEGDIDIYPNPTADIVNISNETNEKVLKIEVYNTLGQLMIDISNPQNFESLHLKEWAAGIYFVKVDLDSRSITKRIKKVRP